MTTVIRFRKYDIFHNLISFVPFGYTKKPEIIHNEFSLVFMLVDVTLIFLCVTSPIILKIHFYIIQDIIMFIFIYCLFSTSLAHMRE